MWTLRLVTITLAVLTSYVSGALFKIEPKNDGRLSSYKISQVTSLNLGQALLQVPRNVQALDLSGNLLTNISGSAFSAFTSLQHLNLSSNMFYGTVNLTQFYTLSTVDLNDNYITDLHLGRSVAKVSAVRNRIKRVLCDGSPKEVYLQLNKVDSLYGLSPLCMTGLQFLDLSLNEVNTIDFSYLAPSQNSLKQLLLSYNYIYELLNKENIVFSLLDVLDLSHNKLPWLSQDIMAARHAKTVDLSANQIVLIDKPLQFDAQTKINLSGNKVQCQSLDEFAKLNPSVKNVNPAYNKDPPGCTRKPGFSICCDSLSAPFADRLIESKRTQNSLLSGPTGPGAKANCTVDDARQQMISQMGSAISSVANEVQRLQKEKIQLTSEHQSLEQTVYQQRNQSFNVRQALLAAALNLNLDVDQDPSPVVLQKVIDRYEYLSKQEELERNKAVEDWNKYSTEIEHWLKEKDRLEPLIAKYDADISKANATMLDLATQKAVLAEQLKIRSMNG
uniref:Putative membrane glycoprotein lig-1 n=1 Tax=Anopheles braziliensis TaxID=58242 RepID=A0A2M3Z5X6_9DIPT